MKIKLRKKFVSALYTVYDKLLAPILISVALMLSHYLGYCLYDKGIISLTACTVYFLIVGILTVLNTIMVLIVLPYRDYKERKSTEYNANEQYRNENKPNPLNRQKSTQEEKKT